MLPRRKRWPFSTMVPTAIGAVILVLSAVSCAVWPDSSGTATRFAPYVDVTLERPSITEIAEATGQKRFILAFTIADDDRCAPTWGGLHPLTDARILDQVRALKAMGGDVVVSSGGAHGPYLEHMCRDAGSLAAAYAKTLDAVGSNALDIDIESSIPVETVNRAVAQLQRDRGTAVSYTLRVLDADRGLEPVAVRALRSAADHGVEVSVNPMVMNFPYAGDWGAAMVSAVRTTHSQMKAIWPQRSDADLYRMLGATAMIGRNDLRMVTTQEDARTLLDFAGSQRLGYVRFWSVARDNDGCPGARKASDTCSGVEQSRFEYTNLFQSV